MHTTFFIILFTKLFLEYYKDQNNATILAKDCYTYQTDEWVAINRAMCPAIIPTRIT
jgi:hypothetical protein